MQRLGRHFAGDWGPLAKLRLAFAVHVKTGVYIRYRMVVDDDDDDDAKATRGNPVILWPCPLD